VTVAFDEMFSIDLKSSYVDVLVELLLREQKVTNIIKEVSQKGAV